jgi:hypothetical protein
VDSGYGPELRRSRVLACEGAKPDHLAVEASLSRRLDSGVLEAPRFRRKPSVSLAGSAGLGAEPRRFRDRRSPARPACARSGTRRTAGTGVARAACRSPRRSCPWRISSPTRVALGQQKGSKRSKSSLCNLAQISRQSPQSRINRAIARQSSPIVVSVEHACHAGGRGFESRRSRCSRRIAPT